MTVRIPFGTLRGMTRPNTPNEAHTFLDRWKDPTDPGVSGHIWRVTAGEEFLRFEVDVLP